MRTSQSEEFEVVVLGAGIAGLLLASELAANHKVLVIERQSEIYSSKYWLTDEGCAEQHSELQPYIDNKYDHIDFIAYNETSYRCSGKYLLWDTERLIAHLRSVVTAQGGIILPGHTFYSYRLEKDGIKIFANDLVISAKLAIDCMGYRSPIIYAKGVVDILGYYLLYGATFPAAQKIDPVGLHNLSLSSQPGYVEAFPTRDNRLHLILILPVSSARAVTSLREEFDFIINRSPYRHAIAHSSGRQEFLGGIIPVGVVRRNALDRLFFFGEAGQSNPAATATALTRMLYTYKSIAAEISLKIKADRLTARDLDGQELSAISKFDRRFQVALFRDVLRWNSDKFLNLVEEMIRNKNDDIVNSIMFGQASSAFKLGTVKELISQKSGHILRNAIKALAGSN
jgi:flavin-dependent dehydrogenase